MWSCCLQEAAAALVSPQASYSKTALLWQHRTGRAQRGLPLALDQADLGPDITSIAAASPLLALCRTVRLTMPRLSAVVSSMQGRGNANLTEGWLTTAATVANRLIFMCYCFQCPTSQRELTALLTSYLVSRGDFYMLRSSRCSHKILILFVFQDFSLIFVSKCTPFKIKARRCKERERQRKREWKGGRMVYCLAAWYPHRAASCPLVAVEDSLNSTFTPPAREWQVPTACFIPLPKAPQIIPLLSRPSGCLNLTRGVLQL